MKRRNFIPLLAFLLLVTPLATMNVQGNDTNALRRLQEKGRIQQTSMSRQLNATEREVRHELLMLPYYSVFDWIEFQVRSDGTVVLDGYVTAPPDTKSRAAARVEDIEGVEQVINSIEVLPPSPADDRLRHKLYQAIYSGPLFRYAVGSLNTIHIIVENGRVTLYGVVDSAMDKQLAYTRARTVPGTFAVNNRLIVQSRDER